MHNARQSRPPAARQMAGSVVLAFALATGAAWAHGGGGGGGNAGGGIGAGGGGGGHAASPGASGVAGAGNGGSGDVPAPKCDVGYVAVAGACQKIHAGLLRDDQLYATGRALALAGDYAQALPVLEAIRRTDDPMVYTMRGFAKRKLGHFDEAMTLYRQALAIDPANVNTHEYIGEGYVQSGKPGLARLELAKVREGCGGTACEQFQDLARAIETGQVE